MLTLKVIVAITQLDDFLSATDALRKDIMQQRVSEDYRNPSMKWGCSQQGCLSTCNSRGTQAWTTRGLKTVVSIKGYNS